MERLGMKVTIYLSTEISRHYTLYIAVVRCVRGWIMIGHPILTGTLEPYLRPQQVILKRHHFFLRSTGFHPTLVDFYTPFLRFLRTLAP